MQHQQCPPGPGGCCCCCQELMSEPSATCSKVRALLRCAVSKRNMSKARARTRLFFRAAQTTLTTRAIGDSVGRT